MASFIKPHDRISLAEQIGRAKVEAVVNDFYNRIQSHPTLSAPFSVVSHWDEHKQKISEFWWVALGGKPSTSYAYDPVGKHFEAGFTEDLLKAWKALFLSVANTHLESKLADAWQARVEMIGENLLRQNNRLIEK